MTPRERRLKSDYEKLVAEFSNHPYIELKYEKGNLEVPEKYFIKFKNIKGLRLSKNSSQENKIIEFIFEHKIEIYLHIDYPRMKPQCYIMTEIFHPNFRMAHPHDICIGDYWASGETLVDIIYQIGDMIMYKNYNAKNPLNGIAAKWAREHTGIFPLENIEIRIGEVDITLNKGKNIDLKL